MGLKKCKECDGSGSNTDRTAICKKCQGLGRVSSGSEKGALWLLLVLLWATPAMAATEWTVENVQKAICAEAIGEGREGMEYVASCLWNRYHSNMSLGCRGLNRPDMDQWMASQPGDLRDYANQLASRVLYDVGDFNTVKGATNFESIDFPPAPWARDGSFKPVFRYKKHVFYKETE